MAKGDGGAGGENGESERPAEQPPASGSRRPTPPPRNRTPPPRTRAGDRKEVEHRAVNRERAKGSVFSRVLGRGGLDDAIEQRFQPYEFQSSRPVLRWLFLALLLFIAAGAYALFVDFQFRSQVNEWRGEGLTEIPIDNEDISAASIVIAALRSPDDSTAEICSTEDAAVNATPTPDPENPDAAPGLPVGTSLLHQACNAMDRVFEFTARAGIDCTTPEQFATVVRDEINAHTGCLRLASLSKRYDTLETATTISTVLVIFATIIAAFPFSTFAHRSSRNLRTLKAEGQKHSPDGLVIRFFIPIVNIYKPLFMIVELFKASDPRVSTSDKELWKKKGGVSPVAVLWALSWGALIIFNPITVARIFFNEREELSNVGSTATGLIAADILIILLGVLAVLMVNTLSHWQDAKAVKSGTVTVTPPRPRDPLEKALEEGIRRQDKIAAENRSRGSKRRKK